MSHFHPSKHIRLFRQHPGYPQACRVQVQCVRVRVRAGVHLQGLAKAQQLVQDSVKQFAKVRVHSPFAHNVSTSGRVFVTV